MATLHEEAGPGKVGGVWAIVLLVTFSLTVGCGSGSKAGGALSTGGDSGEGGAFGAGGVSGAATRSVIAMRPYLFRVPTAYDQNTATPLVIALHAYGRSGALQEEYFNFGEIADKETFLYAYPDGQLDPMNNRFWNADDASCDPNSIRVDDVSYIRAIIEDVSAKYNVDEKRIFAVGHSNGAFMCHRLACDLSDRIAAIASDAGAIWSDASQCIPSSHISVLDLHGDDDMVINYNGGTAPGGGTCAPPYGSEAQTMSTWAAKNGCTGELTPTGQSLDLDATLAGAETSESRVSGCPTGIDVQLWTIQGGTHVPNPVHPTFAASIYAFFQAHPKP
ncbi:MAG: PHB depolymerase family esterase [Polyangia bacterium]